MNKSNNANWGSDIILLIVGLTVFYLLFLGSHHLISPDETRYVGIAWEMWKHDNYVTPKLAGVPFLGKPIMYYWLEILSFNIFGVSEFTARLAPALVGIFTSVFTYITIRTLRDRRTGIIAAVMVSCALMYFVLCHYVNMDSEVASWLTCSFLAFLTGASLPEKTKKRDIFLYLAYIFGAFAFLTKGLMGIVFPAAIIFFWVLILNEWKMLLKVRIISGLILFLIIILPWLILCEQRNPGFLYYFFIWNQFFRFVGSDFNMHNPWYFYIGPVIGGIFPFTLYWIQALYSNIGNIKRNKKKYRIELYILIWILFITIFFSIPSSKLIGYIGPVIPGTAIFMALYFNRIWDQAVSRYNKISTWIIVILYSLLAIALIIMPFTTDNSGVQASAPYAYFLALALIICSILLGYFLIKNKDLKSIFIVLIVSISIVLLTVMADLKNFTLQLNWPISHQVEKSLKSNPSAKVFMYGIFYYSVPMYLNRDVPTVSDWDKISLKTLRDNWQREIFEGTTYEKTLPKSLMTYTNFTAYWESHSNEPIIVIVNTPAMKRFKQQVGNTYHVLGEIKRRDAIIVGNDMVVNNIKNNK